jgi:dihydropyrimidinase
MARALSENPARIFGLYPRKGSLQPGSDADIVVFDPNRSAKLTDDGQHTRVGYTLYAGREVLGWPEMSFQRGRPVLWEGEVVAAPGCGKFLPTMQTPLPPI